MGLGLSSSFPAVAGSLLRNEGQPPLNGAAVYFRIRMASAQAVEYC